MLSRLLLTKRLRQWRPRATKAENALAKVAQKQAKCEEDVVKRLDGILTSVGSKFFPYCCLLSVYWPVLTLIVNFYDAAEQLGDIIKLHLDSAKDPLLDTVGVLESNWKNVRKILQKIRHMLPRLFVRLFPKKKDEMPDGNLSKLVEAFNTLEDSVLQLKLSSVKRGVEGTIALTQSHGESVDWEKVSSSHA
jgi:hypothetical protein